MAKVTHEVHIAAPPERAWELLIDPERIPEYNVNIVEVSDVSGRLDRVGATYRSVSKIYGRRIEGPWEVTEVVPGRRLVLRGSAPGGAQATVANMIEPVEGGTRASVELDYELPAGFVGEIANRLFVERAVERDVRHTGDNIKAILEAEGA